MQSPNTRPAPHTVASARSVGYGGYEVDENTEIVSTRSATQRIANASSSLYADVVEVQQRLSKLTEHLLGPVPTGCDTATGAARPIPSGALHHVEDGLGTLRDMIGGISALVARLEREA